MSLIVHSQKIVFTNGIASRIGRKRCLLGAENAKRISVHKIIYRSRAHTVVGFTVAPRGGHHLPCLIWNRGGSRDFGAIREEHTFTSWMASFAKAGYFVIASQYSGSADSEGKDEHGGGDVLDVITLYDLLKETPCADPSRVGMFGASRGGMMAFLVLRRVSWLKAVAVMAPLTNLIHQVENRPRMKPLFDSMFGVKTPSLERRSVIYWVNMLPRRTPILLLHGTSDWRVDVEDTLDLAKQLYKHRIPYRLNIYEGDDHTLKQHNDEAEAATIAWFDRFVKHREQLPDLKKHGK